MAEAFQITLRGYGRFEVEEALARADAAIGSGSETMRAAARDELTTVTFTACLRGYDPREVDRAVAARLARLGGVPPQPPEPPFMIALRGYDITEVDTLVQQAYEALASGSETTRAAARQALRAASFRQRIRGYARTEVDRAVAALIDQLDR